VDGVGVEKQEEAVLLGQLIQELDTSIECLSHSGRSPVGLIAEDFEASGESEVAGNITPFCRAARLGTLVGTTNLQRVNCRPVSQASPGGARAA